MKKFAKKPDRSKILKMRRESITLGTLSSLFLNKDQIKNFLANQLRRGLQIPRRIIQSPSKSDAEAG